MMSQLIRRFAALRKSLKKGVKPDPRRFAENAPDFILHECNAAVQRRVWRNEINAETDWVGYELIFQDESIQLFDSRSLIKSTYHLAVELNHPIYDCYYLTLADNQNAVLVTAGRKFYERVKESAYANRIAWVGEPPH